MRRIRPSFAFFATSARNNCPENRTRDNLEQPIPATLQQSFQLAVSFGLLCDSASSRLCVNHRFLLLLPATRSRRFAFETPPARRNYHTRIICQIVGIITCTAGTFSTTSLTSPFQQSSFLVISPSVKSVPSVADIFVPLGFRVLCVLLWPFPSCSSLGAGSACRQETLSN
jgi:hypothetical protein